jgi:C_GCAxxG_C_C family probable redox protein
MVTLKLLDEVYHVSLNSQVMEAAHGMNGAGRYGAQCGLVEGMIMFLGILARQRGMTYDQTQQLCRAYAEQFENRFGSLLCGVLRPEAKSAARDPEHACEELKIQAILMDLDFLNRNELGGTQ